MDKGAGAGGWGLKSCKGPAGGVQGRRWEIGCKWMRERLDQSRPLDPWRATDLSNVYRYDSFFRLVFAWYWLCLTLESQLVTCLP